MQPKRISPRPRVARLCEACNGAFTVAPSMIDRGWGKFCGRSCRDASQIQPLAERLWARVDKSGPLPSTRPDLGPCWIWQGSTRSGGYGNLKGVDKKIVSAHRVAYESTFGPIPPNLVLDHLCRVESCVNPHHLEPVTSRENTLRGVSPSALSARKTHCIHGHPFDEENTRMEPNGSRRCKTCARDIDRRRSGDRHVNRRKVVSTTV